MADRKYRALALGMAASIMAPVMMGAAHADPVVQTAQGRARGAVRNGVEAYLGLPFAQAPAGEGRWREPQPARSWQGLRDATHSGPACYQAKAGSWGPYTAEFLADGPFAEDCLTLNVWKPAGSAKGLPVLVYIHGGGFGGGSAAVPVYDGAALARQGAVIVAIQYRVGVFGFAAHRDLSAESPLHSSGNYGLLDQIAALQWVKTNVAKFGGDPGNVTLSGESAGAASVGDLIVSPLAKGLFARAFALSGASMAVDVPSLADGEALGEALRARLGKTSLAEMRAVPPADLVEATKALPDDKGGGPRLVYVPHVDGTVLPHDPTEAEKPIVSQVPLLTGFNGAEMIDVSIHTPAQFEQAVRARYGAFADRLLALYPHADEEQVRASNPLISRDRYMAGLLLWARARNGASGQKVYAYLYDHAYPSAPGGADFGAFHSSQLPYIFGTLGMGGRKFTAQDTNVSRQWQKIVLNFMRKGAPSWPAVGQGSDQVMVIGDHPGMARAVSSPERFEAFKAYAASGGKLGLM